MTGFMIGQTLGFPVAHVKRRHGTPEAYPGLLKINLAFNTVMRNELDTTRHPRHSLLQGSK